MTTNGAASTTRSTEGSHICRSVIAGATTLLLAVTGCATASDDTISGSASTIVASPTNTSLGTAAETAPATTQPSAVTPATDPASPTIPPVSAPETSSEPPASTSPPDAIVGTIVRFTGPDAEVDVTIVEDNATVRRFLSRLPLTIEFEDFNGREKLGYPPGGLDVVESGHDSENGDFIYYVPWGNLGFYYNAAGIEFDNNVVLIGRYEATPVQLVGVEGNVSISIVD